MDAGVTKERVALEAEEWFLRLQEPEVSTEECRTFEHWFSVAEHRAAYARAERLWSTLNQVVQRPDVRKFPEAAPPIVTRGNPQGYRWLPWSLAAAVAALAVGVQLYIRPHPVPDRFDTSTAVGETRNLTLPDRTTVVLDTSTRISVRFTPVERRVDMDHGVAFFEVAPDRSRPFVVATPLGRTTVLGTRFQVRADEQTMTVLLVDGVVRVEQKDASSADAAVTLHPGQQAKLMVDRSMWQTMPANVETATAWRQGRLVFRDTPLSQAIAEVNRYAQEPLRIDDSNLGGLLVNGVFRVGDRESFVLAMEHTFPIQADRRPEGVVFKRRE